MSAPTFTVYNWLDLVLKYDKEHYDPDVAYEFDGGRRLFYKKDRNGEGLYQDYGV